MKFEIDDGSTKQKVTLRTRRTLGNAIELIGSDSAGMQKTLMEFKNGKFYRNGGAELEGLDTDEDGRIMEELEE